MLRSLLALVFLVSGVGALGASPVKASDSWNQLGGDIDGEAAADESGYAVATNDDGSRVIVGATDHPSNHSHRACAYA